MRLHSFWSEFPEFSRRLSRVAEHLEEVVEKSPAVIREDLERILLTPGKMLRPAFLLMASSVGESRDDTHYSVAAAVEILHSATLVHDDIIDRAVMRRGQPTVNSLHGVKKAVLVGDYLLARSLELASGARSDRLVEIMNKSVARLCLSEIEQDMDGAGLFISQDDYYKRIRGKTAELFALSFQAGALLGGAEEKESVEFARAGRHFGMAFQIEDDVLDYHGSGKGLGKKIGNDLRDGIPTLPLILALEGGDRMVAALCRIPLRRMVSPLVKRRITRGEYDRKAVEIGEEFRRDCLSGLENLNFDDRELSLRVVRRLQHRDY